MAWKTENRHDLALYRKSLPPAAVKGSAVMPPSLSLILNGGNLVVSCCQGVIPHEQGDWQEGPGRELSLQGKAGGSPASAVTMVLLHHTGD